MGGMPDIILKGPFFRRLDEAAPGASPDDRAKTLQRLKDGDRLESILMDRGLLQGDAERGHIVAFLNRWPNTAEVVRKTFIEAVELLVKHYDRQAGRTVPLDTYWICGVEKVQGVVSEGRDPVTGKATHVTMILMTPPPPMGHGVGEDPRMKIVLEENGRIAARRVQEGPFP